MVANRDLLGVLLRRAGMLSEPQIEAVLRSQVSFGGRFGTNAVELELLSLDDLTEALASQLGVPSVRQEVLLAVKPGALRLLPAYACARYKILPLGLEGTLLHLAMMDPCDLRATDELSFALGVRIKPYIVPEMRLLYHLERAYGIPREARYLRLRGGPDDPLQSRRYLEPSTAAQSPSRADRPPAPAPAPAPFPASEPELDADLVYLDSVTRAAPPQPPPLERKSTDPGGWGEGTDVPLEFDDDQPTPQGFEDALAAIERAETRDEVIAALVAAEVLPATLQVLLVVRGELATAAAARGGSASAGELSRLAVPLPLTARSKMGEALANRDVIAGSAREDPVQYVISSVLGSATPAQACVAPICIGERVVNLLCLQVPEEVTIDEEAIGKVRRLCDQAAAAYLRLIQRLKAKCSRVSLANSTDSEI